MSTRKELVEIVKAELQLVTAVRHVYAFIAEADVTRRWRAYDPGGDQRSGCGSRIAQKCGRLVAQKTMRDGVRYDQAIPDYETGIDLQTTPLIFFNRYSLHLSGKQQAAWRIGHAAVACHYI